jgi:hypothetical protein
MILLPSDIVFLNPVQLNFNGANQFCSVVADEAKDSSNGTLYEISS